MQKLDNKYNLDWKGNHVALGKMTFKEALLRSRVYAIRILCDNTKLSVVEGIALYDERYKSWIEQLNISRFKFISSVN